MDKCPRCAGTALFAGYEDTRTFYQCEKCKRVWQTTISESVDRGPSPVRVLVADDSDLLVGLVAAWLEVERYEVATATTGRQALDMAAVHQPDVVLLDLIMPQMDGFEVCAKLRGFAPEPEIVLMTGVSDVQHLDRAKDLCAAALLRKPLQAESVIATVASAARRRRNGRQSSSELAR